MFCRIRQKIFAACWCALLVSVGSDHAVCGGGARRMVMNSLARTWGDCSGKPCVTLRVRYPQFSRFDPDVKVDSLNQFVQETLLGKYDPLGVSPVLSAVLDTLVGQFRALPSEIPHFPWRIERTIDVISDTLGMLTLDVAEFRFTGGAHPTTMHLLYMLEPSTMRTMTLEDIIPPGESRSLAFSCRGRLPPRAELETGGKHCRSGLHIPPRQFRADNECGVDSRRDAILL